MTHRKRTGCFAAGALAAAILALPTGADAQGVGTGAAAVPASNAADAAREAGPVTLHLRDTPLRTALQMLFEGSGLQHAVELAVPNVPITLDIRDIPFSSALRTLLRLSPGITYRKEGDIYIVGMRQATPDRPAEVTDIPAPPETVAGGETSYAEKIPIKFLHPAVLAYILNGRLIPTEDQFQPGFGNGGSYGGGLNGGGGFGNAGSGLGPTGSLGGYNQGTGILGGNNPYTNFGNGGQGSNFYVNPPTNSAIVAPRGLRF